MVPIGDDIEPVGESRVNVKTGNEEEESTEERIPTFEMIQKNPTSREQGVGVLFVSKIAVQGNLFKLNRWRKKEDNGQSHQGYLLTASS